MKSIHFVLIFTWILMIISVLNVALWEITEKTVIIGIIATSTALGTGIIFVIQDHRTDTKVANS